MDNGDYNTDLEKIPPIKINIISLWKIFRAIIKFLHDQRINAGKKITKMCWWKKPSPVTPASYRALLFGDNYPGTSYSLNECINDVDDVAEKLKTEFSGFDIRVFRNKEVTRSRFETEIKNAISVGRSGDFLLIWYSGHGTQIPSAKESDGYEEALYLDDGVFTDERMMVLQQMTPEGMIVNANFDSCFSGGMDKNIDFNNPHKNRFYQMPGVPIMKKRVRSIAKTESTWIINAGCGEGQTCADAPELGNGAFTYYFLKCFTAGTSFRNAMKKLKTYLPNKDYDQIPELIGNSKLFDNYYPLKTKEMKAFYDKSVPTRNLVTTIAGIITLIITILTQFGVFTPEQASGVTEQTNVLLTAIPQVVAAIASLILIFKAKD